jgi:hypothetical protein
MVSQWHSQEFVYSIINIMGKEDDFQSILENGISFGRGGGPRKEEDKVKTKAKKKKYITGAHGSGSARQKAKYREQRANRHKK